MKTVFKITAEQLDDMRHAVGSSHSSDSETWGWRNYYDAGEDLPSLNALVEQGLMRKTCDHIYAVTGDGARLLGISPRRITVAGVF